MRGDLELRRETGRSMVCGYPDGLELLPTKTPPPRNPQFGGGDTEVLGGGTQEAFEVQALGGAEPWRFGHRGHPRSCETVEGNTR